MQLEYVDISRLMLPHVHYRHPKKQIVWHETVSPDLPGLVDILGVAKYLADKDYGIPGLTDREGHIAWAYGCGQGVFWQAGGLNETSIGIENVSNIPKLLQEKKINMATARRMWLDRTKQLKALAQVTAAVARSHDIPLRYVEGDGRHSGITTHYSVSKYHSASKGHTDCWPVNDGGYFPTTVVLDLARTYYSKGITLVAPPK